MKGLLLKDFYTLIKQMKIFLIIIIVWTFLPGFSASSYAVVYAAMLPVTALAYDERSKWNTLAAMMPYTVKNLVLSKYILGYIFVGATSLLSIIVQVVTSVFKKSSLQPEIFISFLLMASIALIVQAINLPVMFRLGVEKGRYVFFILIAVFVVGGMAVGNKLVDFLSRITISPLLLTFDVILAAIIINVISVMVSIKIYQNKAD
jgi:ABC-2 type transport system permease protein